MRNSLFYICEITKKYYIALQSHLKAQIKIDFLEVLETQLKTSGPIKDRNIFTSYLEAPKIP